MVAHLFFEGLEFGFAVGAALFERARFRIAVVETNTQRITLGVQLPGALHQLPNSGGELIEVLQHGHYRKPSGTDSGLFTQAEKTGNIQYHLKAFCQMPVAARKKGHPRSSPRMAFAKLSSSFHLAFKTPSN
nr:hypothetical protein [Bordetella holmesii]